MPSLSPVPVQTAPGWVSSNIPGHDLGPGTRGMIKIECDFANPIQAHNHLLVAVTGQLTYNIAQTVTLAPLLAFFFNIGGGSLPARTYYVGVSYTDAAGIETAVQANLINVDANNVARLSQPNPNINVIPNAIAWNAYAGLTPTTMTLQQGGIAPSDFWQEANTGITNTGASPAGKVIFDNLNNTFSQLLWSDGGAGANQFGEEALGLFYSAIETTGTCHIQVVLGCFNGNPTQDNLVDIGVIPVEFSVNGIPGASYDLVTEGVNKQGNSSGPLSIELDNTTVSIKVTTNWGGGGTIVQAAASVVDIYQGVPGFVFDTFIAMYATRPTGTMNPGTPTLKFLDGSTAGTYVLVDQVQSDPVTAQGLIFYLWFPGPTVVPLPTLACPSSTATFGAAYSSAFTASSGVPPYTYSIISGALPPGLVLDSTTGDVTGSPTSAGTFNYTGQVTDLLGQTADTSCSIVISSTGVICAIQRSALVNQPYDSKVVAFGGVPPYTYAITGGSLPPGLTLNTTTGEITGTPTSTGTFGYTVTVTASDSSGGSANCSITVSVCPDAL